MSHTKIIENVETEFTVEVHERLLGRPALKSRNNFYVWFIETRYQTHMAIMLFVRGPITEKTVITATEDSFVLGEVTRMYREVEKEREQLSA